MLGRVQAPSAPPVPFPASCILQLQLGPTKLAIRRRTLSRAVDSGFAAWISTLPVSNVLG